MAVSPQECSGCTGAPCVMVAVAHRGLRQLIVELLERDHTGCRLCALAIQCDLATAVASEQPDLVILDAGDFARSCRDSLHSFPRQRVIVIGPEPDAAYERAAHRAGAGAWLTRERVGEDLSSCMCHVLGCSHGLAPSPPT